MKKYILTLDEGTTSARAILFDRDGKPVSMAQREFTQIYPQPGYVEHNPVELFASLYAAMTEAVNNAGIAANEIAAIGITNQRETTVVWDKNTGEPVYNAIVWQCRRTAKICEALAADGFAPYILRTTGLKPDAYFSGTKLKWILDRIPNARSRAENGDLLFGTIDTWLLWKLSGGRIHATDYTNASRTMLFDIHALRWDEKMLQLLQIPACVLPEVFPSGHEFGTIRFMDADIPICGIAGDQQAALFGQCCFQPGNIKNTYGTGCFLLMNTGETPYESRHGLLTTITATLDGEPTGYALEGSVFIGGAVLQWLRDELGLIHKSADSEACANAVADSGGVYIVPAFAGLGAPYWDMHARGTICGLTRGSNKNHIVRAALESIGYQTDDLLQAMRADTGIPISAMKADGGASVNGFLMQFQADISALEVIRPESPEATALGAAFLAGLTCGFWQDRDSLSALHSNCNTYRPQIDGEKRAVLLSGWKNAIQSTRAFREEDAQ